MVALSSMWARIQSNLFPFLEEELGPMTEKQQKLVSILEISKDRRFDHSAIQHRKAACRQESHSQGICCESGL